MKEPPQIPTRFALYQNFPNPFNPTTTIRYGLPEASHVLLRVYDVLGREIATLVDAHETAGVHEVGFGASRLASGMYFYRIEASGFAEVMKMVLAK